VFVVQAVVAHASSSLVGSTAVGVASEKSKFKPRIVMLVPVESGVFTGSSCDNTGESYENDFFMVPTMAEIVMPIAPLGALPTAPGCDERHVIEEAETHDAVPQRVRPSRTVGESSWPS
jgi:hypothetical protein